jgi:tagatose-6-phosphate ketose/aldose isomerase
MWLKEYNLILDNVSKIKSFFLDEMISGNYEIIFTGAGTSSFIGNVLTVLFSKKGVKNCKSVATTDLITQPKAYFSNSQKVILISFARSGNSPESLAAVKIADSMCKDVKHIFITCNADGDLAKNADKNNVLLLLLPPETNDQGLAMTSSFTTMMLTCMFLFDIEQIEHIKPALMQNCFDSINFLDNYTEFIYEISRRYFSRAIFLGSGELKSIAEECNLKLQELTDGRIICKFDSFLGFRHGPKAVVNNETFLVYFFSGDDYVFQYEKDLVEQINSNNKVAGQIAVSQTLYYTPVTINAKTVVHILINGMIQLGKAP